MSKTAAQPLENLMQSKYIILLKEPFILQQIPSILSLLGGVREPVNCWIYTYIEIPCSYIYKIADTYTRQFPALKLKRWFFLMNWYPKSLFCKSYFENPTRWCWDWLEKRQIGGRFCGRLRSASVFWERICICNFVYVAARNFDICIDSAINRFENYMQICRIEVGSD